jgi:hypothetical protein
VATIDIKKRYRISTQLAGKIAKIKSLNSVTTGINFEDTKTGMIIRLDPIVLNFDNRSIIATIKASGNGLNTNFSHVSQEWFEFIEANFLAQINSYLCKDFS